MSCILKLNINYTEIWMYHHPIIMWTTPRSVGSGQRRSRNASKYHGKTCGPKKSISVSKWSQTSCPANFEGQNIPHNCILYVCIYTMPHRQEPTVGIAKGSYSDLFTKRKEPYSRSLEIRTKISSYTLGHYFTLSVMKKIVIEIWQVIICIKIYVLLLSKGHLFNQFLRKGSDCQYIL